MPSYARPPCPTSLKMSRPVLCATALTVENAPRGSRRRSIARCTAEPPIVQGAKYRAPSTGRQVQGAKYRAPSTGRQVQCAKSGPRAGGSPKARASASGQATRQLGASGEQTHATASQVCRGIPANIGRSHCAVRHFYFMRCASHNSWLYSGSPFFASLSRRSPGASARCRRTGHPVFLCRTVRAGATAPIRFAIKPVDPCRIGCPSTL